MANYHTNDLAIAADTENMKKVLLNFAANLAANSEETGLDFHDILGLRSAEGMYQAIESALTCYYWLAFSGAPVDEDLSSDNSLGWESSTSSASGYASQVEALERVFSSRFQDADFKFGVRPSGRPMSEEASVELSRYGDRWVIQLYYSTAWEPNSSDIDSFFLGLPEGEYGVAFLDADEYDGYETISVFSGVHHGRALLHDAAEEGEDDSIDSHELWELLKKGRAENRDEIDGLAHLAFNCAVSQWNDWGSWEEPYEDDYDDVDSWLEKLNAPLFNWDNPNEDEFEKISDYVIGVLSTFPFKCEVTGAKYLGRNQNIEHCISGSEVCLKSDWNSPYFKYAGIELFDKEGRSLGNVGGYRNPSEDKRAVFACLLPHIRATVVNVETQSSRGDWRKQAHLDVRLELDPIDLPAVLEEMRSLLKLDPEKRSLSSAVSEED
ncbi:hypothetical protein F8C90_06940 [Ellagibacter isourolithinifaciens]|uniref:Uncharacterized protein n=1 Tax=Ellagibacter isourolithinifaciens TaxID=2137581 RepID=A0A6N6NR94_9ACTN|nr:hypothetical protein [Ellagibacter isourolithinifaciens]KAB1640282.1 hypothetical protein F8C90_06940 [Ellagibacter isourolithinifaciens]